MKLLLDTHVIIWALTDSPRLPLSIRDMIIDENNEIYISTVSLWEIAIKHKTHPDIFGFDAETIKQYCMRAGYIFLSVNIDNISILEKMDLSIHKDPFDQMLVAQSQSSNMRLLTHDDKLKLFNTGFVEAF
ncbi:MAG: type II toxin-antitoxin system VapC family toxin [Bacilli bacterium]|nr:type II toxin-antitoxin system VapC family toxin [Bacilli bacterium]